MTTRTTGYRVRGSVLWLTSFTARPLSFQWSTTGDAFPFESSAAAMDAADRAAREYGAVCAVIDPAGNLLVPASALHDVANRTQAALTSRAEARRLSHGIQPGAVAKLKSSGARFVVVRHDEQSVTVRVDALGSECETHHHITNTLRDFAVRYMLTGEVRS